MITKTDAAIDERAWQVLAANDRGGYTVPTAGLYPFQWNWDSAFVAMALARHDVTRAYRELEMLASGQWDDGMIPHIVFHTDADTYFPGLDVWRTEAKTKGRPRTSGITQPPVFAIALRRVHEAAQATGDARLSQRSFALFHAALKWHRWWLSARDPDRSGLVAVLHPWETGSDNSPAWDSALHRVPTMATTRIARQDTGHVDAIMRPTDLDYARYIHLLDTYAETGWDPARQWSIAPFKIADVQTSAILTRATEDLIALSYSLGTPDEQGELLDMHAHLSAGLQRCWRVDLARFVSHDRIADAPVPAATQAGFMPLLALDLDAHQRARVTAELTRWLDAARGALPSVPPFDAAFDAKRYWRGPIWAIINGVLMSGLERNGMTDLAERVRQSTLALIQSGGFAECFDATTGEPCGGLQFSWTAAAWLQLSR